MPRILAVANRKGGVGKTTTTVNVATAMAAAGKKVLVIDLDPQGNSSTSMGVDKKGARKSSYVAPCKPVHEFFWDIYTGMEFLNHEIYENLVSLSTSRSFIQKV